MNWGSWSGFFAMGGAALYVWGAYGVVALALAAELGLLRRRVRRAPQRQDASAGDETAKAVAAGPSSASHHSAGGTPR